MNEMLELAIASYRSGRYSTAVQLLTDVLDASPDNAKARLYLSMCYQKMGRVADAYRSFKRLEDCEDDEIRMKARNAIPLVEAEMKRRFDKSLNTPNLDDEEKDSFF